MDDKLGGLGRLYEHNERMAVEHEKVRAILSGRGMGLLSALVSIVSAIFAGLSYLAAKQAIDQGRQSHLLTERVETCARLNNLTDEMLETAMAIAISLEQGSSDRERLREMVARSYSEFGDTANLAMLGPESLTQAERELGSALHEVEAASWMSPRVASLREAVESARLAQDKLRADCIRAVGAFREGPSPS